MRITVAGKPQESLCPGLILRNKASSDTSIQAETLCSDQSLRMPETIAESARQPQAGEQKSKHRSLFKPLFPSIVDPPAWVQCDLRHFDLRMAKAPPVLVGIGHKHLCTLSVGM